MRVVIALAVLVGIFVCLFVSLSGGSDDPVATPTAQPLNEAVTEVGDGVLETAEEAQSWLCSLCRLGSDDCSGVCK